jgi:hypothetical protein
MVNMPLKLPCPVHSPFSLHTVLPVKVCAGWLGENLKRARHWGPWRQLCHNEKRQLSEKKYCKTFMKQTINVLVDKWVSSHWTHHVISTWKCGYYLVETLINDISNFIHTLKFVEFPLCYHCTFNHLKAQPKSNGKTMSACWFSCHLNVLSQYF